jgi:metallo-beta-lactamase family protein
MRVQFWGAARTVTGSMHLVEAGGHRVLLDCGLYQGKRQDAFRLNRELPFDARAIDAVVLSHAHVDHCGNLPSLVRAGFRGHIWCTSATRDVAAYILMDSAHVQEADVEYVNRRRAREGKNPFEPLYTVEEALATLRLFVTAEYGHVVEPVPGMRVSFRDAGHILGSALVVVDVVEDGNTQRLLFSGDLGRGGLAILRDPEVPEGVDTLVIESTYGDRRHESADEAKAVLRRVIHETCIERRGTVLVPAFALGRTQEIIYRLNELWEAGELPPVDVYVDSPLAINLTEVYRIHPECYNDAMRRMIVTDRDHDPLGWAKLHYLRTVEGSKMLNTLDQPAVIISASGMCEGGRILHHLANHIGDARTTLLFVGFQAENTLGRRIIDGNSPVRIFGEAHDVRARIVRVEGYSAHADRDELVRWATAVRDNGHVKRVFVVHGEEPAQAAFAQVLRDDVGLPDVRLPARAEEFAL